MGASRIAGTRVRQDQEAGLQSYIRPVVSQRFLEESELLRLGIVI